MNIPPDPIRRALLLASVFLLILLTIVIGQSGAVQQVFSAASPDEAAAILREFGWWTPLVSVLLMVLQSVLAPLPGSLIAAANGAIYGIWKGTLLSWVGGMAGGLVTYALGRWLDTVIAHRWKATPLRQRLTEVRCVPWVLDRPDRQNDADHLARFYRLPGRHRTDAADLVYARQCDRHYSGNAGVHRDRQ
jgi:hypothetical protein